VTLHREPLDWLLLTYLAVAWGLSFFLIAVALNDFPPLTLVALRLSSGCLALVIIMTALRLKLPHERAWWGRFTLLAVLGNVIPFTLITWAEQTISSSLAGTLMALMPLMVLLIAPFFLKTEPLTLVKLLGVMLGFIGVVILLGGGGVSNQSSAALMAQFAVIVAALFYTITSIYTKRLPPQPVIVLGAGTLIMGTLMIWPMALWWDQPWTLRPSSGSVIAVLALGVFASGLANWVYFAIIHRQGPGFLSMINYMIPVIAYLAGVWLLAEPVLRSHLLALGLVLLGIALAQIRRSRLA
jgi:drug/metabolite transporter (DMT)-like permease